MDKVFWWEEVEAELLRAEKHYMPMASAHEGFAILKEEVDELWEAVRMKQAFPQRKGFMHREAVQVAAMAIRFLKDCC